MSVITFANQKGGVGKTMTVAATASLLVQEGYRVLLIDLDAQRNLDMVAGHLGNPLEISRNDGQSWGVLQVLQGECHIRDAIVPSAIGDLLRASNQLYGWLGNKCLRENDFTELAKNWAELELLFLEQGREPTVPKEDMLKKLHDYSLKMGEILTKEGKIAITDLLEDKIEDYRLLEKAVDEVEEEYDFILIDTNPTLSLLTLNALYACEYVVIPTFPEASALEATLELYETIATIKQLNPYRKLEIAGVLRTKYSPHRNKSRRHDHILKTVVETGMKSRLFHTKIRDTERASEYVEAKLDVIRHDPTGNTAMDYRAFVKELKACLSGMQIQEGAY